jgi:hypothetical protein
MVRIQSPKAARRRFMSALAAAAWRGLMQGIPLEQSHAWTATWMSRRGMWSRM